MDQLEELARTVVRIRYKHTDSECACSRIAPWLPVIRLELEQAVRDGPSSAMHRGQSHLLGRIGADLMSGSHSLDVQQSVLEAFEQ